MCVCLWSYSLSADFAKTQNVSVALLEFTFSTFKNLLGFVVVAGVLVVVVVVAVVVDVVMAHVLRVMCKFSFTFYICL